MFVSAAFTVTTAAVAQQENELPLEFASDPRLGDQVPRICFKQSIRSFGETTDTTVVVGYTRGRHYLVQTRQQCPGLDGAEGISFQQFSACLTPGDYLLADDGLAFRRPQGSRNTRRCRVEAIYEWDPHQEPLPPPSADR
jgi:hypothetical protein